MSTQNINDSYFNEENTYLHTDTNNSTSTGNTKRQYRLIASH